MPIYRRKGWPRNKHHVVVKVARLRADRIVYGSKADAKAVEDNLGVELRTRAATEGSASRNRSEEKSFFDLCLAQYAPHTKLHVHPNTWATRKFLVQNLIEFFHDVKGVRLSEISTAMLDEYATWRKRARVVPKKRAGGKLVDVRVSGATGRTINNEMKTLSTIRTFAAESLGIKTHFKIKALPEVSRGRVKFWTPEQIAKLYDACVGDPRGRRLLPVLVFLVNTGCRKGEAIHAERRWVDLDRSNGQGEPAPMLTISPNPYWQPKNGEAREVPISDGLIPYLRPRPGAIASPYLFTWARKSTPDKRHPYKFFPNRTFRRLVAKAGLVGGPHTLRHSFASVFLAKQPDMPLLSKVLGHSHEKVTRLYAHMIPDHLENARNQVNLAPNVGPAALEAASRWGKKRRRV